MIPANFTIHANVSSTVYLNKNFRIYFVLNQIVNKKALDFHRRPFSDGINGGISKVSEGRPTNSHLLRFTCTLTSPRSIERDLKIRSIMNLY